MMSTLDRVRRANPWWVVAVYAVIASLLVQIVRALVTGLDLPPWVTTVAWVLLLIGLPVVAVTSFIQHGKTAKRATAGDDSAADDEGDAMSSVFTWSNTLVGGLGGFLALGVSAGAWILSSPEPPTTDVAATTVSTPALTGGGSPTLGASEAFRGLARAIQTMDVEATLALYDDEPGFTHVFGTEVVVGREDFDAQIRGSFAALRDIPIWDIERLEATELSPNTVLVVARIREVAVDTSGVRSTHAAVFTNIYVRRADGWRVSHGHVASEVVEDLAP